MSSNWNQEEKQNQFYSESSSSEDGPPTESKFFQGRRRKNSQIGRKKQVALSHLEKTRRLILDLAQITMESEQEVAKKDDIAETYRISATKIQNEFEKYKQDAAEREHNLNERITVLETECHSISNQWKMQEMNLKARLSELEATNIKLKKENAKLTDIAEKIKSLLITDWEI